MAKRLITPPAEPPVSIEYVKTKLRIDHDDSDDDLAAYIASATDLAQEFLGRALVTQTWELLLDEFPEHEIAIPMPPLQSVESVKYDNEDGDETTIAAADYTVDSSSGSAGAEGPGWVVPNVDVEWPTPIEAINAVRVRFVAGYAPSAESPENLTENIPAAIKQAIVLCVKYWYDGEMDIDELQGLPTGVEPLLRKYRVLRGMA
jgi:uncharacterized phiE125 gp8 family phage protein